MTSTDLFEKRFAAFLFDMDGTLINSVPAANRVWRNWAIRHGLDGDAILDIIHGVRAIDTIRRLNIPGMDAEKEADVILHAEIDDIDGVTAIPGALEFLQSLPPDRWTIATSAPRALAVARLTAAGIPVPANMTTAEDVTQGKPQPDSFLRAADTLGVAAADCLVWEDSTAGIAAGEASGASVAVINALHDHPLDTPHAVFRGYTGLSVKLDGTGALQLCQRDGEPARSA